MGLGLFRRFVVRVYDEAGNVIQTHEHAASSKTRFFACTPSHFPPKTICYGAVREANADSPRCERSGAGFVLVPVSCSDKARCGTASPRHKGPSLQRRHYPHAGDGFHRSNDWQWRAGENVPEYLRVQGSAADLQSRRGYKSCWTLGYKAE